MNKKENLIVIGILALMVVSIWGLRASKDTSENLMISPAPSPSPIATVTKQPVSSPKNTTSQTEKEYSQYVKDFEGRRIQFDMYCQSIPASATFKNGTQVMFDNRSGDARTIRIDGKAYNFVGYGYKIITLWSKTLPHTVKIDCGGAVNSGTILLQN